MNRELWIKGSFNTWLGLNYTTYPIHWPGMEFLPADVWIEPWISIVGNVDRAKSSTYRVQITVNVFARANLSNAYTIDLAASSLCGLLKAATVILFKIPADVFPIFKGYLRLAEPTYVDMGIKEVPAGVSGGKTLPSTLRQIVVRVDGTIFDLS